MNKLIFITIIHLLFFSLGCSSKNDSTAFKSNNKNSPIETLDQVVESQPDPYRKIIKSPNNEKIVAPVLFRNDDLMLVFTATPNDIKNHTMQWYGHNINLHKADNDYNFIESSFTGIKTRGLPNFLARQIKNNSFDQNIILSDMSSDNHYFLNTKYQSQVMNIFSPDKDFLSNFIFFEYDILSISSKNKVVYRFSDRGNFKDSYGETRLVGEPFTDKYGRIHMPTEKGIFTPYSETDNTNFFPFDLLTRDLNLKSKSHKIDYSYLSDSNKFFLLLGVTGVSENNETID